LTQILNVSVPVLGAIYPLAIVLIALALLDRFVRGERFVYFSTVLFAGLLSLIEMINKTFLADGWGGTLAVLPLYDEGVGWLLPALIGAIVGFAAARLKQPNKPADGSEAA
jgi:LIVCS family branched-chain amino acid:cation transporter